MFRSILKNGFNRTSLAAVAGAGSLAGLAYYDNKKNFRLSTMSSSMFKLQSQFTFGRTPASCSTETEEKEYPIYRKADVQKAARTDGKVWVTFRDGVYDLTTFAKNHPGGSDKLYMAKGGPVEPFWQMYPFHKVETIYTLLAQFKIGTLHPDDVIDEKDLPDFSDLQTQNLGRSKDLRVLSKYPYNAETPPLFLGNMKYFYTPPKQMFERNHNLIPEIDVDDYEIQLMMRKTNKLTEEEEKNAKTLTFGELKALGCEELTTLMECAGNKRKALQEEYKTIKGLTWCAGAIGNAKFRGVHVRTILLDHMGLKEEDLKGKHLVTVGTDADFQGKHFEISIPMELALDPAREVMYAYEMNGEELVPVHGFPVRLVCPGMIGVRSCKWVSQICISDEMADHGAQRRDYKWITDHTDMATVNWDKYVPLNFQVVNSAIAMPQQGEVVEMKSDEEFVEVTGWAHGDGGKGTQATKVEVSADGGETWAEVNEYMMEKRKPGHLCFSWTMWKYRLAVPKDTQSSDVNLLVRAFGDDGAGQTGSIKHGFNMRGIMNSAPHMVDFQIKRSA